MKKVLITGVNGMLGKQIARKLRMDYDVAGLGRSQSHEVSEYHIIDLYNNSEIESLKDFQFDYIIHAAANVNLKDCEDHPEKAAQIHIEASGKLASLFPSAKIIYISTDSVYDGISGNYVETDTTHPLNHYARTKLGGEAAIMAANPNHYILRVNIYGGDSPSGKSLFEWGYTSLKNHTPISGFSNVIFNPVSVMQLAEIIKQLMGKQDIPFGIYHIGIREQLSKYTFLQKIAEVFSLDKSLIAESIFQNKPGDIQRPENTTLNIDKISQYLNMESFTIESGMKDIALNS